MHTMAKKSRKGKKRAVPKFIDPTVGLGSKVMPLHHIAAIIQADIDLQIGEINSQPEVDWIYAEVDPSELNADFTYQRFVQTSRTKERAANWKPSAANPLVCVWRTDLQEYRIVDGLQRGNTMTMIRDVSNSKKKIPIVYIECDNIEQEFDMFMTMNVERDKIEEADLHKIKVELKIPASVALDNAVRAAGFHIARPGTTALNALTHFAHTEACFTKYGKKLTTILRRMRMVYKHEKLDGAVVYGFLIIQEKLRSSGKYTKTVFDDILLGAKKHFGTQTLLKRAADRSFRGEDVVLKSGDDEVKLNAPFKIASTAISSYNTIKRKNLCTKLYNNLDIYLIDTKKFPYLHPTFDRSTYGTRAIYEEVSQTGDLRLPWAYFAARRHNSIHPDKLNYREVYEKCPEICECDVCQKNGTELAYGLGKNKSKKSDSAQPSLDHIIAISNGGKNEIDNVRVICERTNRILNNAEAADADRFSWAKSDVKKKELEIA
jgi:5-methylcytosine-specific restriction endonuclease McrA